MKSLLLFFAPLLLFALEPDCSNLFLDLERVEEINRQIQDELPVLINFQSQGGYFTMPSARTLKAGDFGFGFAYVPPYHIWSLSFQFFDHLETSGNYWIYNGLLDPGFGHLGFGDSAERAANFKWILLRREDGFPVLPEFAIGMNDFMGTCRFRSFYAVATKQFLSCNLEASLGFGTGRIKGFYGGVGWTPFRNSLSPFKNFTLMAEYDANNYKHHSKEHPGGRKVSSRINFGAELRLWDLLYLSGSSLRGEELAASIALNYNLGSSKGLFPKTKDPLPYTSPVDVQPLGELRSQQELASQLVEAFQEQGMDLYSLYLVPKENGKDYLWIKLINVRYREEEGLRSRLEKILGALIPGNVSLAIVVIEADGVLVQEYRLRQEDLRRYFEGRMGEDEFRVISPPQEVSPLPNQYEAALLYKRKKPIWVLTFRPWFRSFLGSSRGKFKYETGFALNPEGYLFDQIYYNFLGTYTIKASTQGIQSQDFLNPSKIINVRTDSILYNQSNSWHLENAYVQKSWNLGSGWFSRFAVGYFEQAYAGFALEALYYPVRVNWAIGFQAANVYKRSYYGIGVQKKIRKFTDEGFIEVPYIGLQYFVDLYYQYHPLSLDFKVSVGQFLARDKGLRFEGGKTFESGLRVGIWYTLTNAEDRVNGSRYYDKGFSITMPFDFFLMKSSRTRIGYSMSAWLRDCGAISATGKTLYPTLFWERFNPKPVLY